MPAKRFEYLPHTADVAFVAYGGNFGKALESAAVALLGLMLDVRKIRSATGRGTAIAIEDSASSREDLVWYLLQDILSRIDAEKLNAYDFRIDGIKESNGMISAAGRLLCKDITGDFALLSVKAITPHGLTILPSKRGYSINVVADV